MDLDRNQDAELATRLRRLDAATTPAAPGFDYDGLLARHARGQVRARRRLTLARGSAAALVLILVGASAWRLGQNEARVDVVERRESVAVQVPRGRPAPPRIVRADSHLAVVALEDHIASLDEALNLARLRGGDTDVARLERTRAELVASYSQLRYAEMVSASF